LNKGKVNGTGETNTKTLLIIGLTAVVLGGGIGAFITMGIVFVLQLITPLFFTNFITALFLGNAIIYGLLTRTKFKANNPAFSYSTFIKEAMKRSSFKVNVTVGIIGAAAFVVLLAITLGSYTTNTVSTASLRVISLPLYTLLFVFVFIFYESFFKGYARPMMGRGVRRMGSSVLFESVVLFLTFMLELVVITTVLSQVMPIISFGYFVLGLNLLLIALLTSLVSAEILYEQTGGWLSQTIISAVIFATLIIVFSPALPFF
jgi:hypothetical protein